ncbi:hypothetical protein OIU77_024676 [Salix suchowensis]|uniref:Uncharacterized protein n=1 Tax=Salix suchowensis TaxID=1278906 RepID=A0ABQ9BWG8_9ROSI|nr:hypothetical protein OIU77_024676 [Salix suchowensis]
MRALIHHRSCRSLHEIVRVWQVVKVSQAIEISGKVPGAGQPGFINVKHFS